MAPTVDLKRLLDGLYARSGYGLVIDYAQDLVPPLNEADAAWAREWLKQVQSRTSGENTGLNPEAS